MICKKFGCGKNLSLFEQLCGNVCTAHNGKQFELVGKTTRKEIIDELVNLSQKAQVNLSIDKGEFEFVALIYKPKKSTWRRQFNGADFEDLANKVIDFVKRHSI